MIKQTLALYAASAIALGAVLTACNDPEAPEGPELPSQAPTATVEPTPGPTEPPASPEPSESETTVPEAPETEDTPAMTTSQEQAVMSAESYIDLMGFSKEGLIEQLSSEYGEGFSKADAEFAADQVNADWNAEAVESAESYLEMGGFSRSSLLDQLTYEKFTQAQAEYAVNASGL